MRSSPAAEQRLILKQGLNHIRMQLYEHHLRELLQAQSRAQQCEEKCAALASLAGACCQTVQEITGDDQ